MAGQTFFYADTTEIELISDWQTGKLVKLKYFLTLAFSLLFIGITLAGLHWGFSSRLPFKLGVLLFSGIIFAAFMMILLGITLYQFNEVYPVLRWMIGWLHSPLPYLFLSISYLAVTNLTTGKNPYVQ